MPRLVPPEWMPDCRMERVITHWTAGTHHASAGDREHYHLLIEADGHLVRGDYSIADNASTADDDYAGHTRMMNTGSIGVAVCAMAGAMQRPFRAGRYPMTAVQYEVMASAAADLCERYRIVVTPQTVLGHGEVEALFGVPQGGKWDPTVLPWDPDRPPSEVGAAFRLQVEAHLQGSQRREDLPPVRVVADGHPISDEGLLKGGASWCPLRPIADHFGWTVLRIDGRSAAVRTPSGDRQVTAIIRGDRGYAKVADLCAALGWPRPVWDAAARTVRIRSR